MDDITSRALVSDPRNPASSPARCARLDPADGTAGSACRTPDRRGRRHPKTPRSGRHGREHATRSGVWALAATGEPLPWPAPESLVLKFVAHHLWDPAKRETDPQYGMPAKVATELREALLLRPAGPHAPLTMKRRLATEARFIAGKGRRGVPCAQSACCAEVRGQCPAAPAQEQTGRHARGARPIARDMPIGPPRRHPRSCSWHSPRADAGEARWCGFGSSRSATTPWCRSTPRTPFANLAMRGDPSRPDQDWHR